MAQERKAAMSFVMLAIGSQFFLAPLLTRQFAARLDAQANCHRPGRLGPKPLWDDQ
jgi:hypothetical protein